MLLCRPTPSQCFIISVFKSICRSHSCCAFVAESSFHCVKYSALKGLTGWWHYWISKQRQTTLNCLKLIFMFCCTPCFLFLFFFRKEQYIITGWCPWEQNHKIKQCRIQKDLKVIRFSKQNKKKMCLGLRKNINSKSWC